MVRSLFGLFLGKYFYRLGIQAHGGTIAVETRRKGNCFVLDFANVHETVSRMNPTYGSVPDWQNMLLQLRKLFFCPVESYRREPPNGNAMAPLQLLTQMLPLIVFIIVDSIFNNVKVSIVSAIIFAAVQLLFFYVRTGKFDWFVLLDVGLIAGLGTVSIVFKNDLFFKIKPAIVEIAAIVFLVVLVVLPDQFLLNYFGRMMPKGMALQQAAIGPMKKMLIWMCGYMVLHIGAVLFTAFHSSRRVWAFVSGPGFYLLFIPVMPVIIVKFVKRRRKLQKAQAQSQRSSFYIH